MKPLMGRNSAVVSLLVLGSTAEAGSVRDEATPAGEATTTDPGIEARVAALFENDERAEDAERLLVRLSVAQPMSCMQGFGEVINPIL